MSHKAKSGAVALCFAKLNALFGDDILLQRSLLAGRYAANRFDFEASLHHGNDIERLRDMRELFVADLLTSGWKRASDKDTAGTDKFVSKHSGQPVALYIDPVTDYHGYDLKFRFHAGNV